MTEFNREVAFNTIFWLLYFFFQWLGLASLYGRYDKYFINGCMALPFSFLFSYVAVHVFFKQLYQKGRKAECWVFLILSSLFLLLIRRYINYHIIYPRYFPEALYMPFFSFGKLLVELVNLYAIAGLYAIYYFISSWYQERQRVQDLVQEKTTAELDLLKAQIQPHFVFNTLNNIYSTAVKTSPETARLIAHLSSFLDYNLYESKQDRVSVASEISYIKHYIELQKNRFWGKLDVAVNVYDEISDLRIAPLLLLPLVENSFKHGVANSLEQSWIRIDFTRQADSFSIKIENTKEEKDGTVITNTGGIGLSNVKKRLQLIYPGTHELKIFDERYSYLIVLKINI